MVTSGDIRVRSARELEEPGSGREHSPVMNPRRRLRLLLEHKPPLIAFVLVLLTSTVMLVHMTRSEAAPDVLRAAPRAAAAEPAPSGALVGRAPISGDLRAGAAAPLGASSGS